MLTGASTAQRQADNADTLYRRQHRASQLTGWHHLIHRPLLYTIQKARYNTKAMSESNSTGLPRTTLFAALASLTSAAIWGGMYAISRAALMTVSALPLAAARFALGALALWCIAAITHTPLHISRRDLPQLALIGIIGYPISVGTQFAGTALAGASLGSLITTASPVFMLIFARILWRERTSWLQLAGMAIALVGLYLVVGGAAIQHGSLLGDLLLIGAAASWGLYSTLNVPLIRRYPALTVTLHATLIGGTLTALILPVQHLLGYQLIQQTPGWSTLAAVLYLGIVSTAVAFWLWTWGITYAGTAVAGSLFFAQPIIGILLGHWLFHEPLPAGFTWGGLAIATGVVLTVLFPAKSASPRPAPVTRAHPSSSGH
jgi:drug/metabolite transporter (DMT)-like permease